MDIVRANYDQEFTVVGKICDRCGLRISSAADFWEFQEFVRIHIDVGYGTKAFRDGDLLQCDLCQQCTKILLAPYLRTVATFEERAHELSMRTQSAYATSGGRIIWSLLEQLPEPNSD